MTRFNRTAMDLALMSGSELAAYVRAAHDAHATECARLGSTPSTEAHRALLGALAELEGRAR